MDKKEDAPLTPAADKNQWTDGVCDCCKDPGMCCVIFFCDPITTGQLYKRMAQKQLIDRIPMLSCVSISIFLWICYALSSTLNGSADPGASAIGSAVGMASGICLLLIVCTVRKAVRTRDGIQAGSCGDAEDCCCAFWCNPCTQCQLWRHEQVKCSEYDLCSPTGSKAALV